MKLRLVALALVCCAALEAQDNPPPKCSISGSVEDSVSHQPLEAYTVRLGPGNHSVETDSKGNFQFKDLDPATYRLSARLQFAASPEKIVSVTSGQDLSGIRLKVEPMGTVVGTVTDENGEPVQKADVSLVARDYYRGQLRYILTSAGRTDDKGDYTLEHAIPGHQVSCVCEPERTQPGCDFESAGESQAAEEGGRVGLLWRRGPAGRRPGTDPETRRAQGRYRFQVTPHAGVVHRWRD